MIAKPVVLVAVLNGLGQSSKGIDQTQQASQKKCNERTTR
jgi:hypothetical protein